MREEVFSYREVRLASDSEETGFEIIHANRDVVLGPFQSFSATYDLMNALNAALEGTHRKHLASIPLAGDAVRKPKK